MPFGKVLAADLSEFVRSVANPRALLTDLGLSYFRPSHAFVAMVS